MEGGDVGRGMVAEDVGREFGLVATGGALDVRSGTADVADLGVRRLAVALVVDASSVVSSTGSGIDESSR